MAIGTSFKQQCPSCEAMVPVKDASMVGKKIECPKCKDKFIVKSPSKKKNDDEDDDEPVKTAGKANGKAAPVKKPAKRPAEDEDDEAPKKAKPGGKKPAKAEEDELDEVDEIEELDDVEELDEEEVKKPAGKAKKKKPKEDDEEEEDAGKDKKKKKAGTSKFTMGIILAVLGLVVLGTAAFFILRGKGTTNTGPIAKKPGFVAPPTSPDTPATPKIEAPKENDPATPPRPAGTPLSTVSAELTNLLPNDTDHVAHVPFRLLFDQASPLREALFQLPDGLNDDVLRGKLGFSVLAIDDLLRADHYGAGAWSFTVVHSTGPVDQDAVKKALDLKPAPEVKKHTYFKAATPNPWFEQLARVAIGVPRPLRLLPKQDNRPLFVHFHNPQTLIFADEAPLLALLTADKHFKQLSDSPAPVTPDANQPPAAPPTPAPTPPAQGANPTPADVPTPSPVALLEPFMTIKPALKATIDSMEGRGAESSDKVLFASATDLDAARFPAPVSVDRVKYLWNPRQIWDVTLLLQERNPRIRTLGVALLQKDARIFRLRNELTCPLDNDAKNLQQELADEIAPEIARFIERLLGHKVEVPAKEEVLPPADPSNPNPLTGRPPVQPQPPLNPSDPTKKVVKKEELPTASKIAVAQDEKKVNFTLDLKMDAEWSRILGMASLMSCGLRAEMEVAAGLLTRFELARAGKLLPEKGLSERSVPPGNYPPGAFQRPPSNARRFIREPMNRVSWMAGLLPFLGQETLYGRINFNDSWRDPSNWAPAGTLVSQFLDPTFPPNTRYVPSPALPFGLAATHYVGIAGVGLDAADYAPDDPANITRRGVMGYDNGISLEEVRQGHGLGNTILMLQVPPDSITGVSPWMAGGGSTLRGVPDKNSVAPFVYSVPGKDGKTRRGTHALMADGSVRFIDQNVSDEVFKALATAKSPLPENADLDSIDSKTPLLKAPKNAIVPGKK